MTVGYFSPMPPAATGVADYSAALLPYLGPVRLNQSGDVNLYHIGNNALHRDIYQRALAEPGVIVLHDAVLQHFYLGMLSEDAYVDEFVYNYGEWSRGEAQELWRERARSGADARYFARPMLRRILEGARAVIVHNPAAAAIARAHAACLIAEIPHLFVAPELPDPVEIVRLRHSIGVGARTLLVGTFGHQRETKRLGVLLRAFGRAVDQGADARLLVSGGFVSEAYANTMEPLLRQPGIVRTGHLKEADFWKYLVATDLCVNLRYPSAAESSGVAVRMMGIGKAVAFSLDASVGRIPRNACLRVDTGPAEEELLAEYIVWLAKEPGAAAAIGRRAAEHIVREHAPEKVAAAYLRVLNGV